MDHKFTFGTFDDLEPFLNRAIEQFSARIRHRSKENLQYGEEAFILSLILRKKTQLLACLHDDAAMFANRFETMGREFYREKIPYIDFIKAFSIFKELLIETVADGQNDSLLIKEIYFLAKKSLAHTSKGYLLSMVDADIYGIKMLMEQEVNDLSIEESSFMELLKWFYELLKRVQHGSELEAPALNKCDIFWEVDEIVDVHLPVGKNYLSDMYKRLYIDAHSILYFLDNDDYAGMLPIYSSLMNIYKVSLYILNHHHMKQRLRLMELRMADQKKLEASENRLNRFFTASYEGLVFHDGGTIVDANPATAQMLGMEAEALVGRHLSEFIDLGTEHTGISRWNFDFTAPMESEIRRDGLAIMPIEIRQKEIELGGKTVHVASLHNISQRKEAEEALMLHQHHLEDLVAQRTYEVVQERQQAQNYLDMVQTLMVALDGEGNISMINRAGCELLGYDEKELIGRNWFETCLPEPDGCATVYPLYQQIVRGDLEPVAYYENAVKKRNGEEKICAWHNAYLRDNEGHIIGTLSSGEDITRRRADEEALREAKGSAEAANRAKSVFLANMSHELRTPISAMLGYYHLLDATPLSDLQKSYLVKSKKAADTLLTLIDDILDLTVIESGKLQLERKPFSPARLLNESVDLLSLAAAAKGLTLRSEIDENVPVSLLGDPDRIRQVLVNLIGNAVKYTPQGSIHVSLYLIAQTLTNVTLGLSVSDTGIGISPDQIGILFEQFSRVDNSLTRKEGGTGLGLAICKDLVEAMGGTIDVESEPEQGSTFSFELTFERPELHTEEEPIKPGVSSPLNGVSILLVEDNLYNREIAGEILRNMGAVVHEVSDGRCAVDEANRKRYDLLLMDIQLPEMDGLSATRAIREKGIDLPIVALSAHTSPQEQQQCLDAGMNAHLGKPFRPDALVRLILEWCPGVRAKNAMTASSVSAGTTVRELEPGAEARYWNDPELFQTKRQEFCRGLPSRYQEIASTLEAADHTYALSLLHSLRGSCLVFEADALRLAVEGVESSLSNGANDLIALSVEKLAEAVRSITESDGGTPLPEKRR